MHRLFKDELNAIRKVFQEAGLQALLDDMKALRLFLCRAKNMEQLSTMLAEFGFGDVVSDPAKMDDLRQSLDVWRQVRQILEQYGLGDLLKDPSMLAEILSRYQGMKKAFDETGFANLFDDPYDLKGFLRNYAKLRDAFRELGLEYLLDSSAAMREFLAGHSQGEKELQELRERTAKLDAVEASLSERDQEIRRLRNQAVALQKRLATYEGIGSIDEFKQWKLEASHLASVEKAKAKIDAELAACRQELADKELDRLAALERERLMQLRYKELDVFKLDVIARELKALDNELGFVGKEASSVKVCICLSLSIFICKFFDICTNM